MDISDMTLRFWPYVLAGIGGCITAHALSARLHWIVRSILVSMSSALVLLAGFRGLTLQSVPMEILFDPAGTALSFLCAFLVALAYVIACFQSNHSWPIIRFSVLCMALVLGCEFYYPSNAIYSYLSMAAYVLTVVLLVKKIWSSTAIHSSILRIGLASIAAILLLPTCVIWLIEGHTQPMPVWRAILSIPISLIWFPGYLKYHFLLIAGILSAIGAAVLLHQTFHGTAQAMLSRFPVAQLRLVMAAIGLVLIATAVLMPATPKGCSFSGEQATAKVREQLQRDRLGQAEFSGPYAVPGYCSRVYYYDGGNQITKFVVYLGPDGKPSIGGFSRFR